MWFWIHVEGWPGMVYLLKGVREAPMSERSFLAGETESVFEITNWNTQNVIHYGYRDASD